VIKKLALDESHLKIISRYRGFFFLPLLTVMFFCQWNECEDDWLVWAGGALLLLFSLSIRIWATAHIGRRIPKWLRKGQEKKLVTTGPYSMVRNPLYIANIIAMLGFCVFFRLLWFLPFVFLCLFALYSVVVRHEEAKLLKRFGRTYAAYAEAVPRWFPRIKAFSRGKRHVAWGLAMVGESRSCLLGVVVLLLAFSKEALL
jgi:protein-S-isoprenylcysteine O-methyltransferase Ste14